MTRLPQGNCMYLCVLKDKVAGMTKMEAQQLTPSWHSLVLPEVFRIVSPGSPGRGEETTTGGLASGGRDSAWKH